jgi:hypothetical protein
MDQIEDLLPDLEKVGPVQTVALCFPTFSVHSQTHVCCGQQYVAALETIADMGHLPKEVGAMLAPPQSCSYQHMQKKSRTYTTMVIC